MMDPPFRVGQGDVFPLEYWNTGMLEYWVNYSK